MIHIESPMHPGRPYCDPHYTERKGLQAHDLPLTPGVTYCPRCASMKRAHDRTAGQAARKNPWRP